MHWIGVCEINRCFYNSELWLQESQEEQQSNFRSLIAVSNLKEVSHFFDFSDILVKQRSHFGSQWSNQLKKLLTRVRDAIDKRQVNKSSLRIRYISDLSIFFKLRRRIWIPSQKTNQLQKTNSKKS